MLKRIKLGLLRWPQLNYSTSATSYINSSQTPDLNQIFFFFFVLWCWAQIYGGKSHTLWTHVVSLSEVSCILAVDDKTSGVNTWSIFLVILYILQMSTNVVDVYFSDSLAWWDVNAYKCTFKKFCFLLQ